MEHRMSAPPLTARLARSLRFLRRFKGWQRVATALAGDRGEFDVRSRGVRFAGDLGSHIERQVYLFGAYEREYIDLFVDTVPRTGVVLDIGANVGNHALCFARQFEKVLAFDPNPAVWPQLERNIALNRADNVEVHKIGAAEEAGEFPLYDTQTSNKGLATFLSVKQYRAPIRQVGVARTEKLDDYLKEPRIDAVKIDVQGYEPQVLRGMRRILERDRPVVWTEFSDGTLGQASTRADLEALFPYPVAVRKFDYRTGALTRRLALVPYDRPRLQPGDYVVSPRD